MCGVGWSSPPQDSVLRRGGPSPPRSRWSDCAWLIEWRHTASVQRGRPLVLKAGTQSIGDVWRFLQGLPVMICPALAVAHLAQRIVEKTLCPALAVAHLAQRIMEKTAVSVAAALSLKGVVGLSLLWTWLITSPPHSGMSAAT